MTAMTAFVLSNLKLVMLSVLMGSIVSLSHLREKRSVSDANPRRA
jgi:hypothetical protein